MIESFRHKGLRRFSDTGDTRGISADHAGRILSILTTLDSARDVEAMNLPSYRLHKLSGDMKGMWSVTVRANWRIVFHFENGVASDVDLVDYH